MIGVCVQETLPYLEPMKTLTALTILFLVIPGLACTQPRKDARAITASALRVPPDIARDPVARMMFKEQLRVQVRHKTQGLLETEQETARARLEPQLRLAGFDPEETDYILSSLESPDRTYARGGR
jgi:hypothetical protein